VDGCLAVFPRLQGRTNVSLFFLSQLFGIGTVISDPYAVEISCHFCLVGKGSQIFDLYRTNCIYQACFLLYLMYNFGRG
jgi:hypothetical protein